MNCSENIKNNILISNYLEFSFAFYICLCLQKLYNFGSEPIEVIYSYTVKSLYNVGKY